MKTILVPVDFSDVTDAVLAEAVSLGRALGARIGLIHVAAPDPEFVGYEVGPESVRNQVAQAYRKEHRSLQALHERIAGEGIEAAALLIQGPTVEKVLAEAARQEADYILMGSHGHGALHSLLVGSVTEGVLRGAACPVVIVGARKRK